MSSELVVRCENTDGIIYDGFVNDIDTYISTASLFIAPIYIGAGLKMKITHALACGTPVLTTPVGAEGIPLTEEDGLWVEDDIPSIIEKCLELFRQPEQLEKLSKRAKEKVRELFSQEVVTSKLTSLYKRMIKEHRKRSVSM